MKRSAPHFSMPSSDAARAAVIIALAAAVGVAGNLLAIARALQ